MDEITKNVVDRVKTAMSKILRDVAGHDWGWFSQEDQRMHLQTVEGDALYSPNKVKVWLESKGKRIFELADGKISGPDLKRLKAKVDSERNSIESKWIWLMVRQKWITAELRGLSILITAYPNTHTRFTRKLEVRDLVPGVHWEREHPMINFDYANGMLRVGFTPDVDDWDHVSLVGYLFVD